PGMPERFPDRPPGRAVPEPGGPVRAAGQDSPAVGAVGYREDPPLVPQRRGQGLAGGGAVDPGRMVVVAGPEDGLAIRPEGDLRGTDRAALELQWRAEGLPRGHIPQSCRVVVCGQGDLA